jgi:integrase
VIWDVAVPGLCVRVTDKGAASFAVMRRIKGQKDPVRRVIGIAWHVPFPASVPLPYGLTQAREDGRAAVLDMVHGTDPKAKWQAAKLAEEAASRGAFSQVAEDFIKDHVAKLRSARDTEAAIRNDIVAAFGRRMIASIDADDCNRLVKEIAKNKGPEAARSNFHHGSKLWNWAIAQRCYGVASNPFAVLSAKDLLGRPAQGDRILSDTEHGRLWRGAIAIGYPGGTGTRLLQLGGLRRTEGFGLHWDWVDLDKGIVTIPGEFMKGGATFVWPLAPMALSIFKEIASLRPPTGYVFSTTAGKRPISFFSKLKDRLPALDAPWTFHDLRRSFRTGLSSLNVPDIVSELCLAHAQRGLHRTYDRYAYLDEKRQALIKWENHIREIVEPAPDNVINLRGA